jgi:tetratricopeptide (TPR) repeat protein
VLITAAVAQQAAPLRLDEVTIRGVVLDSAGRPVDKALVRLEQKDVPGILETRTDDAGAFAFSALSTGSYELSAEKAGLHSRAAAVIVSSGEKQKRVDLVLEDSAGMRPVSNTASSSPSQAMEFADKPNFIVAGVTDWTAAGGHGSDTSLRTSEALTRETLKLKADGPGDGAASLAVGASESGESESQLQADLAGAPGNFEANHRLGEFYLRAGRYRESIPLLQASSQIDPANSENEYDLALACKGAGDFLQAREHARKLLKYQKSADLHRLLAQLDEKLDDPLAAVHEYEQAVRMDPSETNYFEWGSELLLHRAVWQAKEVFQRGATAYPQSARMLTALGAALFAGALYDEAALKLCEASDLSPADPEPYTFMGKIEIVAPNPLPCVKQKLARFVEQEPGNSLANYLYAMAIWKGQEQPADKQNLQQVEALLTKAVTLDARCADGYLQLGILNVSQHNLEKAIGFYLKAIEANPELAEAHYRLGVAYDRVGEPAKAKQEFQLHEEIKKQQAAAVERQRREVKQFLVVVPGQSTSPLTH